MHTKALKTLVRIAEVESFAKAADQLGITLSALSMQMKTLEQDLDVTLFDRSHRPPKLTPIGRRVAEQSEEVISAENALIDACHPDSELSGTYRLGFVATASVRLLPMFLKNAAAQVPNVQFEIETGLSQMLGGKVLSGQLDAAVITDAGDNRLDLSYETIREEELLFAVPPEFGDIPLKELLRRAPFIQFNPNSGIGKVIAASISKIGPRKRKTIELDSVEAIMECVNEGIGFTMLAAPDIERYSKTSVRLVKPKGSGVYRELVLATAERSMPRATCDNLLKLFGM